jgi:hypothetical protein
MAFRASNRVLPAIEMLEIVFYQESFTKLTMNFSTFFRSLAHPLYQGRLGDGSSISPCHLASAILLHASQGEQGKFTNLADPGKVSFKSSDTTSSNKHSTVSLK